MQIIASLPPGEGDDPLALLASPPEGIDVVELRLDLFPDLDPAVAVGACPVPLLATLRSTAEGGRGPDDAAARATILQRARDAGSALLDLELEHDMDLLTRLGLEPERVVMSWHNPRGTPADLETVCERLLAAPVRWAKAVPTAHSLADLVQVLSLHRRFNRGRAPRRRLVAFAMGGPGQASRYLAPLMGAPLAYAAWCPRRGVAPGQVAASRLRAAVGHLDGPPQRLYGVVGADVSGSLSPLLHGAGYARLGLPYALLPISIPDPAELDALFAPRGATALDAIGLPVWGWAVTTPHKERAAAAATLAAPRVRRARAANTLLLRPGQLVAENTDADGVVAALLAAGLDTPGAVAVVQGTGGAGRAAAVGLHLAGADVLLRGRDTDRTRAEAEKLGVGWLAPDGAAASGALLVNATPLGGGVGDAVPFTADEVAEASAVVDMVYGDRPPLLADLAQAAGVPYVDGRQVLLHQGLAQFAAFTGEIPPREAMQAALEQTTAD